MIQASLIEPMKMLRKLKVYNDLNITQGKHFLKTSGESCLTKVLQSHGWMDTSNKSTSTPKRYDKKYYNDLHESVGPELVEDQTIPQKKTGFKFQQGICELRFAVIPCGPEILYAVIKLVQFSTKPSEIHYTSFKQIC